MQVFLHWFVLFTKLPFFKTSLKHLCNYNMIKMNSSTLFVKNLFDCGFIFQVLKLTIKIGIKNFRRSTMNLKQMVGIESAKYVKDGMVVGLGTGSTAYAYHQPRLDRHLEARDRSNGWSRNAQRFHRRHVDVHRGASPDQAAAWSSHPSRKKATLNLPYQKAAR